MKLYHQTILPPDGTRLITSGSFTRPKQQEIIAARGSHLVLFTLSSKRGQLLPLFHHDVFAEIRAIHTFRLPGARTDYVLLTSDSGCLSVLLADASERVFKIVHCEPFGKSGCRRTVPGHYLVSDPRGRAVCVAALEKTKLAFLLNRQSGLHPTVSSPLEVHKSNTLTLALASLDVGFENPMFVSIEQPFNSTSRFLVWYEIELGLNQIVRRRQEPIDDDCYKLIAVPGYRDGPGGVLVCSTRFVFYASYSDAAHNNASITLTCTIPLRAGTSDQTTFVVSAALYHGKKNNSFFVIMCTEQGDLLKIDFLAATSSELEMRVGYFDTLPALANSLCILRSGFLGASLEGGAMHLYRIKETEVTLFSTSLNIVDHPIRQSAQNNADQSNAVYFSPHEVLKRLILTFSDDQRSPATVLTVHKTAKSQTTLLLGTGQGKGGILRTLQPGISAEIILQGHQLGYVVENVFALRETSADILDRYVVVTNRSSTKILRIGDEVAEETNELLFNTTCKTILAVVIGDDFHLQVHSQAVLVTSRKQQTISEWKPSNSLDIRAASVHNGQLVIVLSSAKIVYFNLSRRNGSQIEESHSLDNAFGIGDQNSISVDTAVCISIQQSADRARKARFFGVAIGNRVRLFQLVSDGSISPLGLYLAPDHVADLLLTEIGSSESMVSSTRCLHLLCGTAAGYISRLEVDWSTGIMAEKYSAVLGNDSIRLVPLHAGNVSICLVIASRPFAMFQMAGTIDVTPLGAVQFQKAASYTVAENTFGFVSISDSNLTISSLSHSDVMLQAPQFNDGISRHSVPANILLHCQFQQLLQNIGGTPHHVISFSATSNESLAAKSRPEHARELLLVAVGDTRDEPNEGKSSVGGSVKLLLVELEPQNVSSSAGSQPGSSKLFRVHDTISFPCAHIVLTVFKETKSHLPLVIVGHLSRTDLSDRESIDLVPAAETSLISVFEIQESGSLKLKHSTRMNGAISAIDSFRNYVIAGLGYSIRYFEVGIRKLLLKGEFKNAVKNKIVALCVAWGDRVFVGDVMESVSVLQFQPSRINEGRDFVHEGKFRVLASEKVARWINALTLIDYNTVCGSDKFGNIFLLRLSPHKQSDLGHLIGTYDLVLEANFYIGSSVLSLCTTGFKPSVQTNFKDVSNDEVDIASLAIIFSCGNGAIGKLAPFRTAADIKVIERLERVLRETVKPTSGRRHQAYRSTFFPVRNVVDIDYCQVFFQLSSQEQGLVAEKLEMSAKVLRTKLQQILEQNRVI